MLGRRAAALAAAVHQTTLRHAPTALGTSALRAPSTGPSVPDFQPSDCQPAHSSTGHTVSESSHSKRTHSTRGQPRTSSVPSTPFSSLTTTSSSSPVPPTASGPHAAPADSPLVQDWCKALRQSLPRSNVVRSDNVPASNPSPLQAGGTPFPLSGSDSSFLLVRRDASRGVGVVSGSYVRTFAARATDASGAPADVSAASAASASGAGASASASAVVVGGAVPADLEPWSPTKVKTKALTKQVKHIMNLLDSEAVSTLRSEREIPDFKPGDVLAMKVEVPENKRRISLVKGIVIAKRNAGVNSTFRIRRMMAGVGVEMVFPLFSPNIKEMKVIDKRRAKRAKLYYLRDKIARLSTVN